MLMTLYASDNGVKVVPKEMDMPVQLPPGSWAFSLKLDPIKNQPRFREPRGKLCTVQVQDRDHTIRSRALHMKKIIK